MTVRRIIATTVLAVALAPLWGCSGPHAPTTAPNITSTAPVTAPAADESDLTDLDGPACYQEAEDSPTPAACERAFAAHPGKRFDYHADAAGRGAWWMEGTSGYHPGR